MLPRWLRIDFLVIASTSVNGCMINSNVSFCLFQLSPSILLGWVISPLSSSQWLDSHLWTGNLAFSNIWVASDLNLSILLIQHRFSLSYPYRCCLTTFELFLWPLLVVRRSDVVRWLQVWMCLPLLQRALLWTRSVFLVQSPWMESRMHLFLLLYSNL